MPYAPPSPSSTSPSTSPALHSPNRGLGGHRRSRSAGITWSTEKGPGAFKPLVGLPRRARPASLPPSDFHDDLERDLDHPKPLFLLGDDDSTSPDEDESPPTPPIPHHHNKNIGLGLTVDTSSLHNSNNIQKRNDSNENSDGPIPFPLLSPESTPPNATIPPPNHRRPSITHSHSSPNVSGYHVPVVRKSNGQPLKPSLKSSLSSSHIPSLTSSTQPPRPQTLSAPATPSTKAVHFASTNNVVVFDKAARPTAVSFSSVPNLNGSASASNGNQSETEGETDAEDRTDLSSIYFNSGFDSAGGYTGKGNEKGGYPFPIMEKKEDELVLGLSHMTSTVPSTQIPADPHVILESLTLPQSQPPIVRGTVLVKNIAFAKQVYVRFTLDDWNTTSEVSCSHVSTLPSLPPPFSTTSRTPFNSPSASPLASHLPALSTSEKEEVKEPAVTWDRFSYSIRLEDFERTLERRKMYLVVRYYTAGSEWWDNNGGRNYEVRFSRQKKVAHPAQSTPTPSTAAVTPPPAPPRTTTTSLPPQHTLPRLPSFHTRPASDSAVPTRAPYPKLNLKLTNYVPPTPLNSALSPSTAFLAPSPSTPPSSPPKFKIVGGMPATTALSRPTSPLPPITTRSFTQATPPPSPPRALSPSLPPMGGFTPDPNTPAPPEEFIKRFCFFGTESGGPARSDAAPRMGGSVRERTLSPWGFVQSIGMGVGA